LANREQRIPLDWHHVQVRREGQEWRLVHGGQVLADFGRHERAARQALEVFKHYRFNEHCLIGQPPQKVFGYFLVNGQAPRGLMLGLHSVPFEPTALSLRRSGSDWLISDGQRVLLHFGEQADEARQVLHVIQRHKFDHLCRIGHTEPAVLTFLVRSH
jgi:hypothetical protein